MSIDFVVKLPEFTVFDIVITIVDLESKRIYFISMYITITVKDSCIYIKIKDNRLCFLFYFFSFLFFISFTYFGLRVRI